MFLNNTTEYAPIQEETDPVQCILNCIEHTRNEIIYEIRLAANDDEQEIKKIFDAYVYQTQKERINLGESTKEETDNFKINFSGYELPNNIDTVMSLSAALVMVDIGKGSVIESVGMGLACLENANRLLGAYNGFTGIDFLYSNKKRHDTRKGGLATNKKYQLQHDFVIELYETHTWKNKVQAVDYILPKLTEFMKENKLYIPGENNRHRWISDLLGKHKKHTTT